MLEQETKEKLQEALNLALLSWQENPESDEKKVQMKKLIESAGAAGVGFIVKVKKDILNNSGFASLAITPKNAEKYATEEDEQFIFNIPPKTDELSLIKLNLGVMEGRNYLAISNWKEGGIGIFTPQEVTSITLQ